MKSLGPNCHTPRTCECTESSQNHLQRIGQAIQKSFGVLTTKALWPGSPLIRGMPTTYLVTAIFESTECSGTPYYATVMENASCIADEGICGPSYIGSIHVGYRQWCVEDKEASLLAVFDSQKFVAEDDYTGGGCGDGSYTGTLALVATGDCLATRSGHSYTATILDNGDAKSVQYQNTSRCSSDVVFTTIATSQEMADKTCFSSSDWSYSLYTSDTISPSKGLSLGALIGIIAGGIVAVLLISGLLFWYCRRKRRYNEPSHRDPFVDEVPPKIDHDEQPSRSPTITNSTWVDQQHRSTEGASALWEDEVIVGSRVDRRKVVVGALLNRGGFGVVYKGRFNGYDVAVKMLLPETRRSLQHVNAFLAEVKLMASLDHPSVVAFVGVAWESRNDLCMLSEYMIGGDLRGLLKEYESTKYPKGFDVEKVKIAYHIAHALTYLHSLSPPVIHRDLKSKNVLLDHQLNAKLTDFGISRERVDRTMTAGVGTSLWMAPEVMIGDRYDDKADMFSFGVMLSELDVHTLPYSHAKDNSNSGRKIPDAAILQMVAAGKLRVEFSDQAHVELVELGLACVTLDPSGRPTAPEALFKLQKVLKEFSSA